MQNPAVLEWLNLHAATGLQIPFIGYAVMDFIVGGVQMPANRGKHDKSGNGCLRSATGSRTGPSSRSSWATPVLLGEIWPRFWPTLRCCSRHKWPRHGAADPQPWRSGHRRPDYSGPSRGREPVRPAGAEWLTPDQQQRFRELNRRWAGVFAAHEDFVRPTLFSITSLQERLPLAAKRYRPLPPSLFPELRPLLQEMLESGVIAESASPWAAPVVLVSPTLCLG
ncbi:hypothetical protein SKAU_G00233200 [Synaphobranchus kaupii]|uniref:Uncharacterized protein n=1 Tax=Synaphobranchus kaupii TaxID=118154 RepID=A0A9Q1F634_SYNKA|nr:hypothetical protein SKAU_G00233200 [Synaphobranchus kaupii]